MSHRPRKRFGQNFLRDRSVIDKIMAAAALDSSDRVLEIGPGMGALTDRLLESGATLTAFEVDRDLGAELLARRDERLSVHVGDALKLDWTALLPAPPYKLVANLPYNISSQILFKILDHRALFAGLVLMFQKEVGDRIVAAPSTRDYGILSVLMQTWYQVERVVKVPPGAFFPPPKVDSVVLHFTPLDCPRAEVADETCYRRLVKGAFAQRRKTLRNSLVGSGFDAGEIDEALQMTAIDAGRRGETLTIEEFAALSRVITQLTKSL